MIMSILSQFPLCLRCYTVPHRSPFLVPSGLDLHVGCQWTLGHYCLAEFGVGFVLLIYAVRSAVLRVSCRQGGTGLWKVMGGTSRRFLIRGLCDVRIVGLPNPLVWLTFGKEIRLLTCGRTMSVLLFIRAPGFIQLVLTMRSSTMSSGYLA